MGQKIIFFDLNDNQLEILLRVQRCMTRHIRMI